MNDGNRAGYITTVPGLALENPGFDQTGIDCITHSFLASILFKPLRRSPGISTMDIGNSWGSLIVLFDEGH